MGDDDDARDEQLSSEIGIREGRVFVELSINVTSAVRRCCGPRLHTSRALTSRPLHTAVTGVWRPQNCHHLTLQCQEPPILTG
jgi:hypothetical protein